MDLSLLKRRLFHPFELELPHIPVIPITLISNEFKRSLRDSEFTSSGSPYNSTSVKPSRLRFSRVSNSFFCTFRNEDKVIEYENAISFDFYFLLFYGDMLYNFPNFLNKVL